MSKNDSILYRMLDHAHRVLNLVQNSQSTISPPLGDSPNLPDVFYVDSGNGSDVNDGRDPGFPMATIDAAINRCTANQGDVILVQPGHTETLTTQISLDVAGVSIIGVGVGNLRPRLTINAVIDGIDIGANNCRVENIRFIASTAGATAQININALLAVVDSCSFDLGANDILGGITVTANGEIPTIKDCTVTVTADGPDEWILFEGVVDRPLISGNTIIMSDGTDAFDDGAINGGSVAVTNAVITGNRALGGNVAAVFLVNLGSFTGQSLGPNFYSGGANNADDIGQDGFQRLVNDITFVAGTTGSVADHEIFTITGLVQVKLTAICTAELTNAAGDLQYGVAGATDTFITVMAEELLSVNELWYDATPDLLIATPANATFERVIPAGIDIGYEISTAAIADGTVRFICEWKPLSDDGNVVVADGTGTL